MTAAIYEIPTSPEAQTFQIALNGVTYQLTLRWIEAQLSWNLDIASDSNVPILTGLPVQPGVDLLAQYAYLGIGGSIVVSNDAVQADPPSYDGLGLTGHLYYLVVTP